MPWDIRGKTVLITGATDGIGKAVALELAKQGAFLVLISRDKARGEKVVKDLKEKTNNENIEMLVCDLAKLSSVAHCAKEFIQRFKVLNVLIHSAGVLASSQEENDGIERTMAVNYFAPVLLTEILLPMLKQNIPGRLIFVTSSMHKFGTINLEKLEGEMPYDGVKAYSNSKLALMLYAFHLSRVLSDSGITVSTVHPGWIRTKLSTSMNERIGLKQLLNWLLRMRSPARGAESVVYIATASEAERMNGAYVIKKHSVDPKPIARDSTLAEVLVTRTRLLLRDYLALR